MIHLRSVGRKPQADWPRGFPFDVPLIHALEEVPFRTPVTFLVGENGCGKSTLLEAIAAGVEAVAVGGEALSDDPTLHEARRLAEHLRFTWSRRTRRGFFLRAEDFFNFSRRIQQIRQDLDAEVSGIDERIASRYGRQLAKSSLEGQKASLIRAYGEDLNANSHGEGFLKLFESRFVPGGLYLLDEPEAPLSPLRQLTLLSMIKDMVEQDAQFIVATHSPILMALPGATLLSCDQPPPREVAFDELEHVRLTRDFLRNPEAYLRHL